MRTRDDIMKDLFAEVIDDPAALDAKTRRAIAENAPLPGGAREKVIADLAAKIHGGAWRVTEEDIAAARAAGLSEDEVFDLVVAASVGAAKKRFDAAMSALAAAPTKKAVSG